MVNRAQESLNITTDLSDCNRYRAEGKHVEKGKRLQSTLSKQSQNSFVGGAETRAELLKTQKFSYLATGFQQRTH
ncbi:hypothetical protein MHYP_G00258410 [Metynnis hypsauchen]